MQRLFGGVLLMDGAMGTMLHSAGIGIDDCFDHLNITKPELVSSVHQRYLVAGADIIETNTFGANRFRLDHHGLADRVREINLKGVKIAREAREICGNSAFVAGSVGPTQRTMVPYGSATPDEVRDVFKEQIEALLEGGVDLLVIETISDLSEMVAAVEAARLASDLPVVASMTFAEDGSTVAGNRLQDVVRTLISLHVDVIGVNCSVGPQRMLPVGESMVSLVRRHAERSIPI